MHEINFQSTVNSSEIQIRCFVQMLNKDFAKHYYVRNNRLHMQLYCHFNFFCLSLKTNDHLKCTLSSERAFKFRLVQFRIWARIWLLGDIFIFRGTDKLIFIQHFFLHSYRQANKSIFFYLILVRVIQEKWYIQEKLSYWCQNFFFSSYLGSMTMLHTSKHFTAESRPGIPF